MFLFNVVVFSPTISPLHHCLASHCKASGCTYSVDSGSLYKAVGRDPYSSPIHGNSGQEWEEACWEFCSQKSAELLMGGTNVLVGGIDLCKARLPTFRVAKNPWEACLPPRHKPADETAIVKLLVFYSRPGWEGGESGVEGRQSLMATESDTFSQSEWRPHIEMVGDPSRGSTTQICSSERQLGVRQSCCGSGFKKPLKWPRYNSRVGFRFRSSSTSQCLYFVVVNPVLRLSAQSKEWEKWIIKMAIVHPSSATMGQSTWTKNPIKEVMTRSQVSIPRSISRLD